MKQCRNSVLGGSHAVRCLPRPTSLLARSLFHPILPQSREPEIQPRLLGTAFLSLALSSLAVINLSRVFIYCVFLGIAGTNLTPSKEGLDGLDGRGVDHRPHYGNTKKYT